MSRYGRGIKLLPQLQKSHTWQRSPRPWWSVQRRSYASVTDVGSYPAPGSQIHGFLLKEVKNVPELHLTALHLEHERTGAEYLHVARDDKNNVFAINFKTNPTDRTGLPHILEHITLCGSSKFPVRDPFFKMMPRSLANFMNAFTSSDYTSYPFATTNLQDYRNLSSVYLDATLHPLLKHSDFLQEGWRLGPEDPREPATEENVIFKGVVYNEMKGQMSDASYLFYIRFREHIYPSLENSGGDPEKMTNLTHEQLVNFSRKHYHPSNAKIFSYGNFDLAENLQQVDAVISQFDRVPPSHEPKYPLDLTGGPHIVEVVGPLDTMQSPERQVKASVSWNGCSSSDILETFSISIMMSLLLNGYGSPLYQGLIESGLGTNFSPNSGYDSTGRVGIFSIGLDGMRSEDVSSLKAVVQNILDQKAGEAFAPHKIEGYMHQLEIALKHKTPGFGLNMLEKTLPGWFNGVDPLKAMAWNDLVDAFKARLQAEGYLEGLIEKYLLNDNCLQFVMRPQESYNSTLEAQEEKRRVDILQQLESQSSFSKAVISELGQQELNLLQEQESAQDKNLDSLPSLHVTDIARQRERKPRYFSAIGNVNCLWRETATNGITYFQAKYILEGMSEDFRLLMPLFTECLSRLGTKTQSVGDIESEILLKTGGISVSPFVCPDPWTLDGFKEGIMIDGYALDRNVPDMLQLVKTLLLDIDFTAQNAKEAVKELLESKASGALDSVAESGHHFAATTAAASLSRRASSQEQLSGLSQIEATARLLKSSQASSDGLQEVVQKLKDMQACTISNTPSLSLRVVCEPSSVEPNRTAIEGFLKSLPNKDSILPKSPFTTSSTESVLSKQTFFKLPFQVSYTGRCLQTAPYSSPEKAPLTVLGQLLTHNHLHPEVREKGGAYGASASASPISGIFSMSSYRDPNPRNTLNVFQNAGAYARDREWSPRELEESKLSIFQQIDAPSSISGEAGKEFMYGITEDMDQKMRESLLDVTKDDVQMVAQKYLVDLPLEKQSVCLLGEKKDWIDQEAKKWHMRSFQTST